MTRPGGDSGFALTEALVAAALGAAVIAAAMAFLVQHADIAAAHPDKADLQQRARAAADILRREIASAGAWVDRGDARGGPACCVPVVLPRRIGEVDADAPEAARSDVITIVRPRPLAIAAELAQPLSPGQLWLGAAAGCPVSDPACGMRVDDHLLVYDTTGTHDFARVAAPTSPLVVAPRQSVPLSAHAAGAAVIAVETRTLYYDAARGQLRIYDGGGSDAPLIDSVSALTFEYWGTAGVPARSLLSGGAVTCWFDAEAQPRHGRSLTMPGEPDVQLSLATLSDGPWCGSGGNRFDADLLRVRRVRAAIRLGATSDQARGTSAAFAVSGRARSSRLVPDVEVFVDVALRALSSD